MYANKTVADFNFETDYSQAFDDNIKDGKFSFVNKVPSFSGFAHVDALDHTTNDTDGYMFLVNVKDTYAKIFKYTIHNLLIGHHYEFSAYIANVVQVGFSQIKTNIRFEVHSPTVYGILVASKETGDIPESQNMNWSRHSLSFEAINSFVEISMISNTPGGIGNIISIDDIKLKACSAAPIGSCPTGLSIKTLKMRQLAI